MTAAAGRPTHGMTIVLLFTRDGHKLVRHRRCHMLELLERAKSARSRMPARRAAYSCRGARRGGEGLMRRRVSVLLDPLQTPQEARRPCIGQPAVKR